MRQCRYASYVNNLEQDMSMPAVITWRCGQATVPKSSYLKKTEAIKTELLFYINVTTIANLKFDIKS